MASRPGFPRTHRAFGPGFPYPPWASAPVTSLSTMGFGPGYFPIHHGFRLWFPPNHQGFTLWSDSLFSSAPSPPLIHRGLLTPVPTMSFRFWSSPNLPWSIDSSFPQTYRGPLTPVFPKPTVVLWLRSSPNLPWSIDSGLPQTYRGPLTPVPHSTLLWPFGLQFLTPTHCGFLGSGLRRNPLWSLNSSF